MCWKGADMTIEEAINYITYHGFISDDVKDMTIAALEKQIPKKPDLEGDGYADGQLVYDTWICPNCEKRYEVDYEKYDYCPNCGQKIDWSEVEE
jgi:rubrerythrin